MRACAILALLLVSTPARAGDPDFEVLVLGTYHAPVMFRGDGYTPAHIRAALIAAEPDVVAVESHPEWFAKGRYHVVTYEAEGVAVPWARARGIPAVGVDWKDIEAWDRMEEATALGQAQPLRAAFASGTPLSAGFFGKWQSAPAAPSRTAVSWEHINGVHDDAWAKSRFGAKTPDQEDFVGRRDRGIADHCVAAMAGHRGKRLAVVVGAHHKPFLDFYFGRMKGVRVLRLGRDVPLPSAEAVAAAWTSDDLVNSLGHTLDAGSAYFHEELADLPRARKLLKMLAERGDRPATVRYFRARVHVLAGEAREAEKALDALLQGASPETLYPFPMREWRMRFRFDEAVRLEKARLLLERGAAQQAGELLRPLVKELRARLERLEAAQPGVTRRVETIKDAGFEKGGRASDIFAGWDTFISAGSGMLRWTGDKSVKVEGERSLRIEVTESSKRPFPFHVRQEVKVPLCAEDVERVTFGLSLRGTRVSEVTLLARPAWNVRDRTPLAEQAVSLTPGKWTRAEITFPLPPSRAFALFVEFKGPRGAKLWLDGGTRLPVEYTTIPLEWSRLAKALAFLEWLLAGRPGGQVTTAVGLRDAGFESGRLAASPLGGWHSGDLRSGALRARAEETVRVQGKRSLLLEVAKVKSGVPHILSQATGLPAGEEFEFQLSLRAEKLAWVRVDVGVWETQSRFRSLVTHDHAAAEGEWGRATVRFRAPKDKRSLGIFVYFAGDVGGRLWLDDARLRAR